MSDIIRVQSLSKQFRNLTAVDDLSFTVREGDVYGFLGQNGAGKSTTIRMLLTLIAPTKGSMELFGYNLQQHRIEILRQVGAVIEKPDMYGYLSAYENLKLFAKLSGIKYTQQTLMQQLEMVGLAERAHDKVRTFSQGMKQRLGIAVALVHDPQLIILDEPANGLDPQGIADIRNLILTLGRDQKKTILVSSHLLSEVEQIADKLIIIHKGKKMVEGTMADLIDRSSMQLELHTANNEAALGLIKKFEFVKNAKIESNKLIVHISDQQVPNLVRYLVNNTVEIHSVFSRRSLEDYFLSLTSANHVDAPSN